ncbi:MAG: hypothetical protein IJP33_03330 [Firmicutes bacterium]|nr:hypothetical protein [Bacillota bacterium]
MLDIKKYFIEESGKKIFRFGRDDDAAACECAEQCGSFAWDDDEECLDDCTEFCYNCRYRRWTESSFCCMKTF